MATRRRVLPVVLAVLALLGGAMTTAAADDPLADIAPATLDRAERVLDAAPAGVEPEVLVTTRSAPGAPPRFETLEVDGRVDALETIAGALADPDAVAVEMVQPARIAAVANDPLRKNQWYLDTVRPEQDVWPYSKGAGVKVAVIDTGVMVDHPDLRGRVTSGKDIIDPGTWARDENGHGTHVAGVIAASAGNRAFVAGLAPKATIVPVRVLDARGSGTSATVAAGIRWATSQRVQVINLSITMRSPSAAVAAAVQDALAANVVVVAAAGNTPCPARGTNPPAYPAALPGVIGVGALARSGGPASFSSCGSWVDIAAPGSQIMSLTTPKPRQSGCRPARSWCLLSGTSMASPQVAAAAALRIARTGITRYDAATVTRQVLAATRDVGAPGIDSRTGAGVYDLRKLLVPRS